MFEQSRPSRKPSRYFNFGVGWESEDQEIVSFSIDWERNKKANNGQGYKLFLVPVDESGEPIAGEEREVTRFRTKRKVKAENSPEEAPNFSCYAWE